MSTNSAATPAPTNTFSALVDQFCNPDLGAEQRAQVTQNIVPFLSISNFIKSKQQQQENTPKTIPEFLAPCVTLINNTIRSLGEYLTSKNERIRIKSYQLLHQALEQISKEFVPLVTSQIPASQLPAQKDIEWKFIRPLLRELQKQSQVPNIVQVNQSLKSTTTSLLKFFCERFHDFDCLQEVLSNIQLILQVEPFASYVQEETVAFGLSQLFSDVQNQGLSQQNRKQVYELLELIMIRFPNCCNNVEFLTGFIQASDAERDPVCLLKVFQMVPLVCQVSQQALEQMGSEELFDIISCYFPISFKPPPNDPRNITPESLSDALRIAIASHPSFSPYCIPFLLEKIASAIIATKVEGIKALAFCITQYGELYTRPFLLEIWATLRTEVLQSGSHEVVKQSLNAIKDIAKVVSSDPSNSKQNQQNLEPILRPCLAELKVPNSEMKSNRSEMIAYASILNSLATASTFICSIIISTVSFEIMNLYMEKAKNHDLVKNVLVVAANILEPLSAYPSEYWHVHSTHIMNIWSILYSCIQEASSTTLPYEAELIEALSRIAILHTVLQSQHVAVIYEYLSTRLLNHEKALSDKAVKMVEFLYKQNQKSHIIQYILEPNLSALINGTFDGSKFDSAIATVSSLGQSCVELIPFILKKLFLRLPFLFEQREKYHKRIFLQTIHLLIERAVVIAKLIQETDSIQYIYLMMQILEESTLRGDVVTDQSLTLMDRISKLLFLLLAEDKQQVIIQDVVNMFVDVKFDNTTKDLTFLKSKINPNVDHPSQIVLHFASLLSAISPTTAIPKEREVLEKLLQFATSMKCSEFYAVKCTQAAACLLNKISDDKAFLEYANLVQQMFTPLMNSEDREQKMRTIVCCSWIWKGLVLRGIDPSGLSSNFVSHFASLLLLQDESLSLAAANAYHIVMEEYPLVLHKDIKCKVQVLYKQKYFSLNLNYLLNSVKTIQQAQQVQYNESAAKQLGVILYAISHLISKMPKNIIVSEVDRIFPLVISSIDLQQESNESTTLLLRAALSTLQIFLAETKDKMLVHIDSISNKLLRIAANYHKSMEVRILAIQSLHLLVSYPFKNIFPVLDKITKGLEPVLDDKKRKVRKEAVACRNDFFLLCSPSTN